ncbi:MAG: heavy metal translocating P-type ATPase [Methyloligellaceae bacterium]
MTAAAKDFCEHCGLALGPWPHTHEIDGSPHVFCCYGCFIGRQVARGGGEESAAAGLLIRLGLGAFLAMNIMLFSLLLYAGGLDGADPGLRAGVHGLLWALATPVLVVLGGPFFREAWQELRHGRASPSLLIALGSGAAYLFSAIATVEGADRVYFDTATMVLVLFTLGRYLEANGRAGAMRSLRPMLELESQRVRRIAGDRETIEPLSSVVPGMLVRVLPGERIFVDGVVQEGRSQAEEACITGEPLPVVKGPGAEVVAGSLNGDGELLVCATAAGLESRWVGICNDVRAALARPTRSQRIADQVARIFVPLVVLIALATGWVWWQSAPLDAALMAGLAVLVVACPCALGLAAPLAVTVGVDRLARTGILVRSGADLERLAEVHTVAFDKTGTLTAAEIQCRDSVAEGASAEDVLRHAACVARGSPHPLSKSILARAEGDGLSIPHGFNLHTVPGEGVEGRCGDTLVRVGHQRWLAAQGTEIPEPLRCAAEAVAAEGHMLSLVAWDGSAHGVLAFGSAPRPEASAAVRGLEDAGLATIVLTGDGPAQAAAFSRSVGVESWQAELSPEDKRRVLEELASDRGPTAMVGDGLNDGPALSTAAIGIAVGDATDLARETADVVLPVSGLRLLPHLFAVARQTRRTVVTNLLWAFGYNAIAIGLAAAGMLQPVIAAGLMAGSSFVVVANTLARREQPPAGAASEAGAALIQGT